MTKKFFFLVFVISCYSLYTMQRGITRNNIKKLPGLMEEDLTGLTLGLAVEPSSQNSSNYSMHKSKNRKRVEKLNDIKLRLKNLDPDMEATNKIDNKIQEYMRTLPLSTNTNSQELFTHEDFEQMELKNSLATASPSVEKVSHKHKHKHKKVWKKILKKIEKVLERVGEEIIEQVAEKIIHIITDADTDTNE